MIEYSFTYDIIQYNMALSSKTDNSPKTIIHKQIKQNTIPCLPSPELLTSFISAISS